MEKGKRNGRIENEKKKDKKPRLQKIYNKEKLRILTEIGKKIKIKLKKR